MEDIKNKNQKGFSIIEVLVCIFIVSVGLIGTSSLVTQNLQVQYINKNNLIASQLSQEGIELVRNIRDRNWLDGKPFYTDIANASGPTNLVVYFYDRIAAGAPLTMPVLDINDPNARLRICTVAPLTGFYGCPGGIDTIFSRMITTTYNSASSKIDVTSIVEWKERGNTRRYIAESELYNWIQ